MSQRDDKCGQPRDICAHAKPKLHFMVILFWASVTISGSLLEMTSAARSQNSETGKFEYQVGCAACHGSDAKGMGPVGALFGVPPPDLTVLAKKNEGVFPFNTIYEVIDGRKVILAHGTRDMPIWGTRFLPTPNRAMIPDASGIFVNPSYDPEMIVRMRILALIEYLIQLQQK